MSYDPTLARPYHKTRGYANGEKDGVTFEIIETQPGDVDVYISADLTRGQVIDLLSDELKGYYIGTIHKLTK